MDEVPESQDRPVLGDNLPEQTVSELANALEKTVRENFGFLGRRGERGTVDRAPV